MKKKTLLSVAVAVMLVAAMAVTAFAAPGTVSVSAPDSVDPGQEFTVTVSGTGEGVNGSISFSGAEVVSVGSQLCSNNAFVLLPGSGMGSVAYTVKATAEAGGTITVSLSNCFAAEGNDAVAIDGASASISVNGGSEPTQEPTQAPTNEPTQAPSGEPTQSTSPTEPTASGAPSGSAKPTAGNQDKMPKTGDATMDLWVLAVIAAGCTGAALVAGKKVFSHK